MQFCPPLLQESLRFHIGCPLARTEVQARDEYITKFPQLWSSTIISVEDITIVKKQDSKLKGVLV